MLASEVIKRYDAYCPQEFSMEGDVRGLQVGTLQKDIHKVMVALDIRVLDDDQVHSMINGFCHRLLPDIQGYHDLLDVFCSVPTCSPRTSPSMESSWGQ